MYFIIEATLKTFIFVEYLTGQVVITFKWNDHLSNVLSVTLSQPTKYTYLHSSDILPFANVNIS